MFTGLTDIMFFISIQGLIVVMIIVMSNITGEIMIVFGLCDFRSGVDDL